MSKSLLESLSNSCRRSSSQRSGQVAWAGAKHVAGLGRVAGLGIACLVGMLVTLAAGRGASGQQADQQAAQVQQQQLAPPPAEKPLVRELFVPYRDLHVLLEGPTRRVFLTRDEYEQLLAKARRAPIEAAPIAAAVTAAEYVVTVEEARARISATLTIEVLEDGLHVVPLAVADAGVRRAALDGEPARLAVAGPNELHLFVTGKGRKSLVLELTAPLGTTAASQSLAARLPNPPATRMRLTVPGNVEVKGGANVVSRQVDDAAGVTRFDVIPSRDGQPLVMSLNNRQLLQQRMVLARSVMVAEVTRGYERLYGTFSMSVVHGAADTFAFVLPEGFEVTEVRTPLLAKWGVADENAAAPNTGLDVRRRVLTVTLNEAVRDNVLIDVVATRMPPRVDKWSFPQLVPGDVAGHVAVLGVLAEHPWKAVDVAFDGLIPIDLGVLAQALPASVAHVDGGAPPVRPVSAFYAPQPTFTLDARFTLPPPGMRVTSNVLLTVAPQRWEVRGGLAIVPEVEKLFSLDLLGPTDWHVTAVTAADGTALPFEERTAPEGRRRLHVRFPTALPPDQTTSVFFTAEHNPAGWLGTWANGQFPLAYPVFGVAGASREDGAIAVRAADEFQLTPGAAEALPGLTPLSENEKPAYGLANVPTDFAYRFDAPPYAAAFAIERVRAEMTARTVAFLKIDADVLTAHYEVAFDIQRGKTSRLAIELPASTPLSLTIRGFDGAVVKEFGVDEPIGAVAPKPDAKPEAKPSGDADATPAMRRWWVRLAEPATERVRLVVDFTQRLESAEPKGLPLPILRAEPAMVNYQSGLVSVEGSADLDVQLEVATDGPGNPRRVDIGELAEAEYVPGRRLLGAYGYTGESPELKVDVNRRPAQPLPEALVERAELVTLVGTNGRSITVARYRIRSKVSFLELSLPTSAKLWSVQLDGQPVAPQRSGDHLLLSVSTSDGTRDLQLAYEMPLDVLRWRGTIAAVAPQLRIQGVEDEASEKATSGGSRGAYEVRWADLEWKVRLPSGFRVVHRGGTVYPDKRDPKTREQFAMRVSPWVTLAQGTSEVSTQVGRRWQETSVAMAVASNPLGTLAAGFYSVQSTHRNAKFLAAGREIYSYQADASAPAPQSADWSESREYAVESNSSGPAMPGMAGGMGGMAPGGAGFGGGMGGPGMGSGPMRGLGMGIEGRRTGLGGRPGVAVTGPMSGPEPPAASELLPMAEMPKSERDSVRVIRPGADGTAAKDAAPRDSVDDLFAAPAARVAGDKSNADGDIKKKVDRPSDAKGAEGRKEALEENDTTVFDRERSTVEALDGRVSDPLVQAGEMLDEQSLSYWALEGIRSLPMGWNETLAADAEVVTFRSLGVAPELELTLVHQGQLEFLGWALALVVTWFGFKQTGAPWAWRLRFVVAGLLATTLLPLVAPWHQEVGLLSDRVFFGVIAVTGWYVIVALARFGLWLINSRDWTRTTLSAKTTKGTPTVAILAALIGLFVGDGASVHAQDATPARKVDDAAHVEPAGPPVAVPDDVILIPYDHEDADGANRAARAAKSRIMVPYDKYVELWNLAYPDRKLETKPAPAPFVWAGVSYEATLGAQDDLEVVGKLNVDVLSPQPVDIPLPVENGVLTRITVNGQPASIRIVQPEILPHVHTGPPGQPPANGPPAQMPAQQSGQQAGAPGQQQRVGAPLVALTLSGEGRKEIALTIRMKVQRNGGWRAVNGRLPAAAATGLTLRAETPETDIRLANVPDRDRFETKPGAQVVESTLGADGRLNLQWRPRVAAAEVDRSLTAQSDAEVDVREDSIRLTWRVVLDFRGGRRDNFSFHIPDNYALERVVGENVRGWSQAAADGRTRIDVQLLKTAADAETMTLVASRRGKVGADPLAKFPLPAVNVDGAKLHQGLVVVRRSPILDVKLSDLAGLGRAEFPGASVSEATSTAEATPLGMRPLQALRFQSQPFQATIEAAPVPDRTTATLRSLLKIEERRALLETQILVHALDRPTHRVRIELPPNMRLESVIAPQPFEWAVTGEEPKRLLTLFLGSGQRGQFPVVVRGQFERKPTDPVPVPRVVVQDVVYQNGELVVQVDPSIAEVSPEQMRSCDPIQRERTYSWLADAQRGLARLALAHRGADYGGQLVLKRFEPRVTCFTVTNVRVTTRSIAETILLEYKIEQAGVRELAFTLPSALRAARISAPMLRRKRVEPVPAAKDVAGGDATERVLVTLELQDEVMGQFRVLVENDRLLTAGSQPAPVPAVVTGRTDQRFVTFETAARDELVFDEQQGMQEISRQQQAWSRLAALFGENILTAYLVDDGQTPRLTYQLRGRTTVETVGARIALSQTDLFVDGSGAYRGRQTYQVDNGTEQFLVIELPEGAELWTVSVAGEPVRPQKLPDQATTRQVRIPLVKTAVGDVDFPVVLVYGGKLPEPGAFGRVRFPFVKTVNIDVELSRVRLMLPETHRWLRFDGSMGQVDERGEYEASFLSYKIRQMTRLSEILTKDSSDRLARLRASNNLKQLGLAMQTFNDASVAGNAEFQQNYSLFNSTVEQTRQQADKELAVQLVDESKSMAATDNREKLNDFYLGQSNQRARNVVTQLEQNFDSAQVATRTGAGGGFDTAWFAANGLKTEAPMQRVIMNEPLGDRGEAGAPAQPGKPAGSKMARAQGQAAAAPELEKGFKADVDEVLANDAGRMGRGKVRADEQQSVVNRYNTILQSQLGNQQQQQFSNAAPGQPVAPPQSGRYRAPAPPMTPPTSGGQPVDAPVNAPAATPARPPSTSAPQGVTFLQREGESLQRDAGGEPSGERNLVSLDVELPDRGTEFLFRTPRGDLELTAVMVASPLVDRLERLAVVFGVLVVLGIPWFFWRRR